FPELLSDLAISLRMETGKDWPRTEILAAILNQLDKSYCSLKEPAAGTVSECIASFEARSSYARGKRVHVPEEGGYDGTTDGLDARGFLRVKTSSGIKTVLSGGVRPL